MKKADFYRVASQSVPGKHYLVRKTGYGYFCNCPDCVMRSHDCKHIQQVKDETNRQKDRTMAEG